MCSGYTAVMGPGGCRVNYGASPGPSFPDSKGKAAFPTCHCALVVRTCWTPSPLRGARRTELVQVERTPSVARAGFGAGVSLRHPRNGEGSPLTFLVEFQTRCSLGMTARGFPM